MPLQATSGAASYDAFGGGVAAVPNYIEECFSTFLYQGNGSTQTITNGIDLAGKGGLVWTKSRNNSQNHIVNDTVRGAGKQLIPNLTLFEQSESTALTSFNSNGFSLGSKSDVNDAANTYVSWTLRRQPKFFDVVTFTQSGTSGWQTVNHSLGSVPGCIIFKNASTVASWPVYHRYDATKKLILDSTSAAITETIVQNLTSTSFEVSISNIGNNNGDTFVAYLFAHNAGGFGLTGTDNVISCGSFTGASMAASVNLGWEPQWVMVKRTDSSGSWQMYDNMRGMYAPTQAGAMLFANSSGAETVPGNVAFVNSTGFFWDGVNNFVASGTPSYIYIAIRRGPMKVPTTGTSVFAPVTSSATGSVLTSNFPVDMGLIAGRGAVERGINDRLRGFANTDSGSWPWLVTQGAAAEISQTPSLYNANNTSIQTGAYFGSASAVSYLFRRAPGFFDEVCYTGTGSATTFSHNLGVAPELMIMKSRNVARSWAVYSSALGATKNLFLNAVNAEQTNASYWNNTAPTASVFSVGDSGDTNFSGWTYVAYLFASCPGVSKVGSYTGTGTTQTINCGFTAGSRFVMIKRTDSTGDWYVWDSARGIVAGNDPYLLLNSTAAEVTTTDWVDTAATGFELSSTAPAAINASGGTFLFLAIA